jgi:ABC-type Fe3+-hydroxamate transport system substrate-binding protein
MRFIIVTAALAVLLSACGGSSASGHNSPVSANLATPRPTAKPSGPTGTVLLDVKGAKNDSTTRAFTAPATWKAHYTFQCMVTNPVYRHGVFQIYGIDPKHPNGQETIILYALTEAKVNKGISDPVDAGSYRLRILADPVCSWHVVVKTV